MNRTGSPSPACEWKSPLISHRAMGTGSRRAPAVESRRCCLARGGQVAPLVGLINGVLAVGGMAACYLACLYEVAA